MTTAGYSGRTLAQKLGVKDGHKLALVNSPTGWSIPDAPAPVILSGAKNLEGATGGPAAPDITIWFIRSVAELVGIERLCEHLPAKSSLWVAWPRKAGGHQSDMTEQSIRDAALPLGLVDVKVAALDSDWSGLKLVWRVSKRAELSR